MPSATEEQVAPVHQKPDESDLFVSRRSDLRLVRKPARDKRDAEGNAVERIPGETVRFRDGQLRIPHKGEIRLEDGRTVPAKTIREWLEAHPLKGDLYEGFTLAARAVPPIRHEELNQLVELATSLDVEGLQKFIAEEEAGWNREELLTTARGALERLEAASSE